MPKIKKVILPKDNRNHNLIVEWWYFNGHLYDNDNNHYSFMDCFFKVNISKIKIPFMTPYFDFMNNIFKNKKYIHFAHSVISDIKTKKSYKEVQYISLLSKDSFKKGLLYINYKNANLLDNTLNYEINEISPNNFNIKTKNINLNLESKKRALFEGGHGYVGKPESGSYYYSFTDLNILGKISIKGKEVEVRGKGWMDHQWADATYKGKKDKWTWFSFQMENGTEIMCVEYESEQLGKDTLIDMIDKDGKQTQYKNAEFFPLKNIWKSNKTKTEYPLSWNINIPKIGINIKTNALMKDQEIIFGEINYWEGPIKVVLDINGKKIKGVGYMELVGYPSDYNYLILESKEIKKNIKEKVKNVIRKF